MTAWKPISDRPEWDHQPIRQFVMLVGSCTHHGDTWARAWAGEAFIRKPGVADEMLQYRLQDILRLCRDGDIDPETARITHWMPATFPPLPPTDSRSPSVSRPASNSEAK
jgi:hypothetical protein